MITFLTNKSINMCAKFVTFEKKLMFCLQKYSCVFFMVAMCHAWNMYHVLITTDLNGLEIIPRDKSTSSWCSA